MITLKVFIRFKFSYKAHNKLKNFSEISFLRMNKNKNSRSQNLNNLSQRKLKICKLKMKILSDRRFNGSLKMKILKINSKFSTLIFQIFNKTFNSFRQKKKNYKLNTKIPPTKKNKPSKTL